MTAMRGWAVAFLITQTALIGCASTGNPGEIEVGENTSFDGLLEVTNAKASAAWVRPDFDLSGYTRIRLEGAGIKYRPVRPGTNRMRTSNEGFPISPADQERLAKIMYNAFERELAKSTRFTLTDEVGYDVLTVWGGLLDVVSFVPPPRATVNDPFVSRLGEATLVIELRDSESNATVARMIDRRSLEQSGGRGTSANAVNAKAEVERLATKWAQLLRRRLDESLRLKPAASTTE